MNLDHPLPPPTDEAREALHDAFTRVETIVVQKNRAYGDAWQRQGYMGNLARILSKVSRLEEMQWCDKVETKTDEESVAETVLDLIALSSFFLDNWQTGNRWGRRREPTSASQR